MLTITSLPLREISEFLRTHDLPLPIDPKESYGLAWEYLETHPDCYISSIYLQDFLLAHRCQRERIKRVSTSFILSGTEEGLRELANLLGLNENNRERMIRIMSYLDLLDHDVSLFDLLPKDILRIIEMKLDCRSLGNWGQISRTFYQSLVLTGEMTEMLRIKLYQITRLDLTHYTKEELGFLSQVNEKKPKISIGRDHTLILDDEGRVSSFGSNEFGQLGTSKVLGYQAIPILIEISDIIEVSAGAYHSILLNSQGQVYSFGSNNFGQLGLRYEGGNVSTPTLISTITSSPTTKIIAISAGSYYSLFLNSQGQVFSCGANEFGQLGLGDNDERYEPTLIEISNIVAISAGESDSLALNSQGQAYYFGSTFYPRGIKEVNDRRTPRLINLSNIVAISIERHSLLLDSQGQVYNFGENASGRYDVETRNGGEFTVVPVTKPDLGKIRTIAAGGTNSLLCNTRDQIFSTGYYDNQLVLIDTSVIDKIDPLGSARVAAISAGDSNFLISNLQGQVFDLEFGDDNDHPIPTLVENLAV